MEEKYNTTQILEAVDILLKKKPLKTNNDFNRKNILPKDTENIISQAESYIKK